MSGSGDPADEKAAARALKALARADGLRASDDARSDVVAVYLEHRDRLEPGTPEGTERLRFLLEHVPRTTQGLEDLFFETAHVAPDPDVADRALVASATFALARGDFEAVHARLHEALIRRRGSDTAIERSACINLARALCVERRWAEALLVARRAATMTVSDDEARGRAAALGVLGTALTGLRENERALEVLAELGRQVPTDPDDAGAAAVRSQAAWLRITLARNCGKHDEAIWRLDVLRARDNPRVPAQVAGFAGERAAILIEAGRTSEAAIALAETRSVLPDRPQDDVRISILESRVAAGMDDMEAARERAEHALHIAESLVDTPGPHHFWVAELVSVFTHLGDLERSRRCLEILATERLEQIARTDRAAGEIPELAGPTSAEDRAILRRARERALVESRDTLTAFAHLLAPALRDGDARALVLTPADDDLIRVCAWCARIAGRDGRWLPLGHLIPADGPIRATHGMCPDCLADSPSETAPTRTP